MILWTSSDRIISKSSKLKSASSADYSSELQRRRSIISVVRIVKVSIILLKMKPIRIIIQAGEIIDIQNLLEHWIVEIEDRDATAVGEIAS